MINIIALIIAWLIGLLIGLSIDTYLNKQEISNVEEKILNLEKINRVKDEMIELYEKHCKDLEGAYNNCQSGINVTINENIELRKKLSKVK